MPHATVHDFRQRFYKDVTLPSGLVVRIRKITLAAFVGIGELPVPMDEDAAAQEGNTEQAAQRARQYLRYGHRTLAEGVVDPPMTDVLDDGGKPVCPPDVLHAQELFLSANEDYMALVTAIQTYSGFGQEVRAAVDTFRQDAISQDGGHPGREVSPVADHDSGLDAGRVLPDAATGESGPGEPASTAGATPAR